ncbi:MAG TPA: radical SAM protein [Polyangia bacterium]
MDLLGFEKILYHPEKLIQLRRNQPQFPTHATISLGNYCNHKCLWCTAYEAQLEKATMMDVDRLLGWLERAKARGLRAVGYVGNGEPTAHPRFAELVRAVKALGIEQGMFTNGLLLDRHADDVRACFTYVRISLDAGTPRTHARMHVVSESQYDRIMGNLRRLIAARTDGRPTVGIQFATHHENFEDLSTSCAQAAEIGADYFSIKPVFNRGSVGELIEKNRLALADFEPVVAELRRRHERAGFQIYFRPEQVRNEVADRNTLPYDRCVAGFFNLGVYEDGGLTACGPHHVSVGTMDDDLEEVERRILATSHALDLSRCPGGCRYHALNHLVDAVLHPERAAPFHPNFL